MGSVLKQSLWLNAPETSSKECSSNHKANFNHKDRIINDSILEKIINMSASYSMTETISSSSSDLEPNTSNLSSKFLLMDESSSFYKNQEAKSSKKRTKEEYTS